MDGDPAFDLKLLVTTKAKRDQGRDNKGETGFHDQADRREVRKGVF